MDWKDLPDGDEKRHAYYASREWALFCRHIDERSHDECERCHEHKAVHHHHITYRRLYHEALTDVLHLCEGCHQFVHGRGPDPLEKFESVRHPFMIDPRLNTQRLSWMSCPTCGEQHIVVRDHHVEDTTDDESFLFSMRVECTGGHEWVVVVRENDFGIALFTEHQIKKAR